MRLRSLVHLATKARVMASKLTVKCDYCGEPAELVRGDHGYIWECKPCEAWVKAYDTSPSKKPMGSLANAELRQARKMAHAAFDPLWQAAIDRRMREGATRVGGVRSEAYRWLADQLGIPADQCHFTRLSLHQCKRVVTICDASIPIFMHGINS